MLTAWFQGVQYLVTNKAQDIPNSVYNKEYDAIMSCKESQQNILQELINRNKFNENSVLSYLNNKSINLLGFPTKKDTIHQLANNLEKGLRNMQSAYEKMVQTHSKSEKTGAAMNYADLKNQNEPQLRQYFTGLKQLLNGYEQLRKFALVEGMVNSDAYQKFAKLFRVKNGQGNLTAWAQRLYNMNVNTASIQDLLSVTKNQIMVPLPEFGLLNEYVMELVMNNLKNQSYYTAQQEVINYFSKGFTIRAKSSAYDMTLRSGYTGPRSQRPKTSGHALADILFIKPREDGVLVELNDRWPSNTTGYGISVKRYNLSSGRYGIGLGEINLSSMAKGNKSQGNRYRLCTYRALAQATKDSGNSQDSGLRAWLLKTYGQDILFGNRNAEGEVLDGVTMVDYTPFIIINGKLTTISNFLRINNGEKDGLKVSIQGKQNLVGASNGGKWLRGAPEGVNNQSKKLIDAVHNTKIRLYTRLSAKDIFSRL